MENYVGEIRLFAGAYAPPGWQLCDGSLLQITQYGALFSLLGTQYGGDGRTTFALPDLRGRIPVGQGTGSGLSPRIMGQRFGAEFTTITEDQCPTHEHTLMASSQPAASGMPAGLVPAATSVEAPIYDTPSNVFSFDARAIQSTGADQPHLNVMPSLCINFIIATQGNYPARA